MKWSVWVGSGIGVTLIWLIAMAPARLLTGPAAGAGIKLGATQGTLWSGSAGQLHIRQDTLQYSLADVHWHFEPAGLLQAAFCYTAIADASVDTRSPGLLTGRFCIQPNGTATISKFSAELPAATLFRSDSIRIQGTVLLEVDRLVIGRDQTVQDFSGQGQWIQAGVTIVDNFQRAFFALGNLALTGEHLSPDRIELVLSSDEVSFNENSSGLTLHLRSQVSLDGTWQVNGKLKPDVGMSAETRDLLTLLTEPDKAGNFSIYWQGP